MGGWPVGYSHNAVEKLNSGQPRTNPDSSRVEDLNKGPPDFKSSALNHSTTLPPFVRSFLVGLVVPEATATQAKGKCFRRMKLARSEGSESQMQCERE